MALNLLAGLCVYTDGFTEAEKYLERALQEAATNPTLMVHTKLMLSFVQINAGSFDASLRNVEQAALDVVRLGDSALTSQVLSMWVMVKCICGEGIDDASLQRSLELEDYKSSAPIVFRASANNAQLLAWTGKLDEARSQISVWRRRSEERGADDELLFVAVQSVLIEIWSGNLSEATLLADDAVQRAQQLGGDNSLLMATTVQTAVASYTGRERDAREYGRQALEAGARCGSNRVAEWPAMMLGFLEVSLGRYSEALKVLDPLVAAFPITREGTEIISATFIPDAVEAMVALGRVDDAEPMIAALERNGARLDRPWMLAVGARCRAMAHAARGDVNAATSTAQQAMAEHDRLPMPFERARTQLLLGQLQRRARQKDGAAASMDEALRTFKRLGTPVWAARAGAERERTKVAWSRDLALTPSEEKVAEQAASGATNRDIAASLFISEKTVEANMTRIYRKLGIRSRAELGRRLDASHM
jgi:DNA-binding CsgD family transcriptional regulator